MTILLTAIATVWYILMVVCAIIFVSTEESGCRVHSAPLAILLGVFWPFGMPGFLVYAFVKDI